MPFCCARCGHVSRDADEIRESYCASCGDWSPNAALAPEPEPPADLEYECRGCGSRFWVPGSHKGQVFCSCREERPCLPYEPRQAEVLVRHAEVLGLPVDLVTSSALLAGYVVVGTTDSPNFGWLMAGRSAAELEADVAALRAGITWYQRARQAAGRLIIGALQAIGMPRFFFLPESDDSEADDDYEDWANPYSWRPGDPEL